MWKHSQSVGEGLLALQMTNATSWLGLQPGVLWHPYDCLQTYRLNGHSVLSKLPVLLCLLQISSYVPLLGGHTSNSAWLATTQIILWNLQANLNKETLQWLVYQAYYALVYQEYKKQISPAEEDSLCHNSQCHQHWENQWLQWLFPVTENQSFWKIKNCIIL